MKEQKVKNSFSQERGESTFPEVNTTCGWRRSSFSNKETDQGREEITEESKGVTCNTTFSQTENFLNGPGVSEVKNGVKGKGKLERRGLCRSGCRNPLRFGSIYEESKQECVGERS